VLPQHFTYQCCPHCSCKRADGFQLYDMLVESGKDIINVNQVQKDVIDRYIL